MVQRIRGRQNEQEGGFTLIELLIVIVVLGILAGIVVFGVGTFRADSTLAACKADLKTVSVANDAYNAKTGAPAIDVATLVGLKYLKTAPVVSEGIEIDAVTKEPASTLAGCVLP
jgi:prepilin-type N-terminal cleavage/methylation domain-containing protein